MDYEQQQVRARKNSGKLLKYCSRTVDEKHIPFVSRVDNPPNVPQARPIETLWTVFERKIYENN